MENYPKTKEERKSLFDQYDDNGNNLLAKGDIAKMINTEPCFQKYNVKTVILQAFKAADKYGKQEGYITRTEFIKFLEFIPIYHKLWVYFDEIDVNNDRRIDLNEFKAGVVEINLNLNESESEEMFKKIDINQGGTISFDEFCEALIDKIMAEIKDEE